jgi:hypothetical protein
LLLIVAVRLIAQDQVQERIIDFDFAVVLDVAQSPKLVHELIDTRARGADHVGEHFLVDRKGDETGLGPETGICQHQESPRQPLLARVEYLIDQIRLQFLVSIQDELQENVCK